MPENAPVVSLEDALIHAVLALVEYRAGNGGTVKIKLSTSNGWEYRTTVLSEITSVLRAPNPSNLGPGCANDIIQTLREINRRLTTHQLIAEMERRGRAWSDTKIKTTLPTLVEDGRITNEQRCNPKGYGLPDWPVSEQA